MVQFKETIYGNSVTANFKSPEPSELKEAVDRYFGDYPYAGYMTYVVEQGQESDGTHYFNLWRMSSCD